MGQKKKFIEFIAKQGCHSSGAIRFIWDYFGEGKYPKTYIEVGVKHGVNVERIRQWWKATTMYLVDPWAVYALESKQEFNDAIYKQVFNLFKDDLNTHVIREYSVNAAKILDGQYDIIFIDGDHSYKHVMADIKAWYPRVRDGGILCGHDYSEDHPDVKKAVVEYFGDKHIFTGKGQGDVWFHIKKKEKNKKIKTVIRMIASKRPFHLAAAMAGATFRKHLGQDISIQVYIPRGEQMLDTHLKIFNRNDVQLRFFDFNYNKELRYTTQLKPQGYVNILKDLQNNEVALLLDSDTYCIKPFEFTSEAVEPAMTGMLLMSPEPWNRYKSLHGDKTRPDFIPKEKRLKYVNSGVMLASNVALDMFERFVLMSRMTEFSLGPFHDQTIINFALCHYFPKRIEYLGNEWNGVCTTDEKTIIGHNGQGVGVGKGREGRHFAVCTAILADQDWFKVFKSFDKKK